MKTLHTLVIATCAFALASCNKEEVSHSETSSEQATSADQPFVWNNIELSHYGNVNESDRHAVWIQSEDENAPLYIFLSLKEKGVVEKYHSIDWREDGPFDLIVSKSQNSSRNLEGFRLTADYRPTHNLLRVRTDGQTFDGGIIKIPAEEMLAVEVIGDLQDIVDQNLNDFAWQSIGGEENPTRFTLSQNTQRR